jgi:hypothetical protein
MYSKDAVAARGVCDRGGQSKCEKDYSNVLKMKIVFIILIEVLVTTKVCDIGVEFLLSDEEN